MAKSGLVFSGGDIKLRLEAARISTKSPVHIDWLRFTVQLRNAPYVKVEDLFPHPEVRYADQHITRIETSRGNFFHDAYEEQYERKRAWVRVLRELGDDDFTPGAQAKALAESVAEILGSDFSVSPELKKGKDFYKHRWEIVRAGHPVGWVGFCATGTKAHLSKQAQTIHCNLEGMACTFADAGWPTRIHAYMDEVKAVITRCDLALDFFEGIEGGIHRFPTEFTGGLMDVHGSRPTHNQLGPWLGGKGLSFYFGSKHGGKQTNIYEKGIQLFGEQDPSPWLRVELRYGSQKRFIPMEILTRPADFFSGASDWHSAILLEHGSIAVPESIPQHQQLPIQTIEAEVTRNVRWMFSSAGRSMALAFINLPSDKLLQFVTTCTEMPKRLKKFKRSEVETAFSKAYETVIGNSEIAARVGRPALLPI